MEQFIEFIGNHWMLSAAFVFLVVMLLGGEISRVMHGQTSVDPQSAIRILNQDNAVLLDVREENEYQEGWAANAVRIPLSKLKQNPDELDAKKDQPVIAYCKHGQRSNQAASLLRKQGYTNVYNLSGGLNAWRSANLPVYHG